ncbi:DUF4177 domain-containing protein [Rhodobacteraceae bacterium]|nr:DUF4177 domain-containing protein [Paracoccaceae bacterium]
MQHFEYKAIPAPQKGDRERGLKTGVDRFASAFAATLNAMAFDGWEYVRAETLPAEERSGLTGKTTVYHNILVFRRAVTHSPSAQVAPVAEAHTAANAAPAPTQAQTATPSAKLRAGRALDAQADTGTGGLSARAPEGRSPRLGAADRGEDPKDHGK